MFDVTIRLPNRPGALAEMGAALGEAGVSVEGGGGWVVNGDATLHFLFEDGEVARCALESAGIEVVEVREVLVQKLDQGTPGQLGKIGRAMADAGVNIDTVYSDHANQLILAVDDVAAGKAVSDAWTAQRERKPRGRAHQYVVTMSWTGNTGTGTATYRGYSRNHDLAVEGKPLIGGSSDPTFRGDRTRWNPEELLVGSLAACHQLAYLHLCADSGIIVTAYEDRAEGVMREDADGGGHFERVVLRPAVTITDPARAQDAATLHRRAHELCFIARSVNFSVEVEPEIR